MNKRKIDIQIRYILETALQDGLTLDDIRKIPPFDEIRSEQYLKTSKPKYNLIFVFALITVLYAIRNPDLYYEPRQHFDDFIDEYWFSWNETCLVYHSGLSIEITRPPANCRRLCEGITQVPVVQNITPGDFLQNHAYTGVPVLIKNATSHWSALKTFSFQYFRQLYDVLEAYEENEELGCQFFPYKTNFRDLKHVLHMSKKRANLEKDQWYIGWSNCVPRVMKSLRKHYERPYFLPNDSESSQLDWMFMGGSGTGADMHIDAVNRPSWQAMIKGKKTWYFEPPPECENVCQRHMSVTMEPGDILVVDTNRWYHSTYIHPGEMSITIGSEYD